MSLVDRAVKRFQGVIDGDRIEWSEWMRPGDVARIIPAEALAERGKASILLGVDAEAGISLPWGKLGDKVRIKPGKVCVWSGWTHHGKSAMLKQVMLSAIQQGERVLIASMEEEVLELWRDMAIMAVGNAEPTSRAIDAFVAFIAGMLWLYDQQGAIDPTRAQALIRYAASELKVTQLVIDSLMMLAVNRDDYEAQARFCGDLKAIAKDTGCTVHLVCHLRKRDGKSGDDAPGNIFDIAGGHEISGKADYVFNVWRDKARKNADSPSCVLSIEKQRGRINWLGKVGLGYHEGSRQFVDGKWPIKFWPDRVREPGEDDDIEAVV